MQTDRHLLLGLLALQCGFISKDQLVAAFGDWTNDKNRSLEEVLAANQAITSQQMELLRSLVEEHLKQHGNDPEKSLAALSSLPPIKAELEELADPDVSATLVLVKSGDTRHHDGAATNSTVATQSQGGRFVFLRAHAKGGLGQVSVALDSELNRHVALKEILPQRADDRESQGRFVLEAEITGQLEHPGIVPVYGLGNYGNGRPYYAMRFVEGENLKRAIERFHHDRKPSEQLTGERAVAFRNLLGRFVDVCNAIEYAHSRKVLHRDLKPENILLGPYGETLVVDWGLAKPIGAPQAQVDTKSNSRPVQLRSGTSSESYDGMVVGTPAYMSPEQAEGKIHELGPATDVYSLGATLYPLLTGNPPIKGESLMETLEKARLNQIERPRTHWGAIPKPLEAVCLKAMALQPRDRYSSAKALAEDIEKWLADEPVSAFVEPFSIRAKRWIKRHPVIVSTSAACVVLGLCAALFVAYLQGANAKELARKNGELTIAKNQAEAQRGRAEQREQDAIDAVKRFGDAVTNNKELKNNPTLESLRKELLKEPLGFFNTLRARLQGDYDTRPESLARLARAAFDLGHLTNEIGDKLDGLAAYQEALAIRERLARENPSVTEFKHGVARSSINLGNLLHETGKPSEALVAYEQAKKILVLIARDHPTAAEFQIDLAISHNNLGALLSDSGKPAEALTAYEQAKSIRERLVRENPSVAQFQSNLAGTYHSIGALLQNTGKPVEALTAYEQAKTIGERLANENPSIIEFQSELARIHNSLGVLFRDIGESAEAIAAHEQAKTIRERLVRENPSVTQFQSDLAQSHNNLGALLDDTGKPAEALAAYEQAKIVRERLAREYPSVTEFQNVLGGTLHNLAMIHVDLKEYAKARDLVLEAIKHQELALAASPRHTTYRQFLKNHLTILLAAAEGLQDAKLVEEAEREMLKLSASDPQFAALDLRITNVLAGEPAKDPAELLAFGERAYDLQRYVQAARFYGEAFERNPSLVDDRAEQLGYNAACSAALASGGEGVEDPKPDDSAKTTMRRQALTWLNGELDRWGKYLEAANPKQGAEVVETLKHWQEDADLAGVRDEAELAKLPEAERGEWLGLWKRVGEILAKAEAPVR